jgi:drug/metabolite transporter (DMT)-like permease
MTQSAPTKLAITATPTPLTPIAQAHHFTRLDIALIFAMALWGGNFVVSKAATEVLPPLAYNAIRFSIASLSMLPFMLILKIDLRMPRSIWRAVLFNSFIGHVLYQPFFINSIKLTTASNAVLIITAGPIWVVLFNAFRGQEQITKKAVGGVFLALIGVVTVIVGRYGGQVGLGGSTATGDLLMVIASVLWAIAIITSREPLAKINATVCTFWLTTLAAGSQLILGFPSLVTMDWSAITPLVILGLVYSGAVSVVLGSLVFNYAINKIGTARTSVYTYVQPVVAATLAVLFLGERFTPILLLGAFLIFVGVALVRRT